MTNKTPETQAREPASEQHVVPRRNPFQELWNFQQLFDHLDCDFFTRPLGITRGEWFPRLDVRRQNGDVVIEVELPGMTREDVEIEVTGDGLVISGEKRQETETREDSYYRSERSFGRFTRRIALPHGTRPDKAEANFDAGILRIRMPVKQPPEKRTISVNT